jgi:cytochrome c-type biogenesis protein CcmH/NrfG
MKSFKQAIIHCKNYLKVELLNVRATELLAASYHANGDFDAAFKTYESLLPICNYSLRSVLNTASAADFAGYTDKAEGISN